MSYGKVITNMTEEELRSTVKQMVNILIEARDALPAITLASAKLYNVRLDLGDRIENIIEPWRIGEKK